MRIVSGVCAVVLIVFAAVQYNDPDALFWAPIYAGGAVLCALAAFRPRIYAGSPAGLVYAAAVLASLAGVVRFWPSASGWWMQEVWWENEAAREGMGMMVLAAALLLALPVVWRHRGRAGHGEKRLERI